MTTTLLGGCHCGNIRVALDTALALTALPLRACQCSFCLRHGAVSTSDPEGRLRVQVAEPDLLLRYRFGLKLTDFLVCRRCGVYVAAVMDGSDGRSIGVLNVNILDAREPFARPAEPMRYGNETAEDRVARRQTSWMPIEMS